CRRRQGQRLRPQEQGKVYADQGLSPPALHSREKLMNFAEITAVLDQQFGTRIKEKKADVIDPFIVVEPADLLEVCQFLRDDPRLKCELLNCINGVDYLGADAKKAPKACSESHDE